MYAGYRITSAESHRVYARGVTGVACVCVLPLALLLSVVPGCPRARRVNMRARVLV